MLFGMLTKDFSIIKVMLTKWNVNKILPTIKVIDNLHWLLAFVWISHAIDENFHFFLQSSETVLPDKVPLHPLQYLQLTQQKNQTEYIKLRLP